MKKAEAVIGGLFGGILASRIERELKPTPLGSALIGTGLAVAGLATWKLAEAKSGIEASALFALAYALSVGGAITSLSPLLRATAENGFVGLLGIGLGRIDGKEYLLGPNGIGLLLSVLPVIAFAYVAVRT